MEDKQSLLPPTNYNPYEPVVSQPQMGQGFNQQYQPGGPTYQATNQGYNTGQIQGQFGASFGQTTSAVVSNQPQPLNISMWSSGLCDCSIDMKGCLLEYFCGPCSRVNMATRLGESALYGCCCGFHFSSVVRPYIRAKHNIQGSLMEDCCMSCWCHSCNMCQISRELDRRSYPKGCLF